jgi:hypothetical protein
MDKPCGYCCGSGRVKNRQAEERRLGRRITFSRIGEPFSTLVPLTLCPDLYLRPRENQNAAA